MTDTADAAARNAENSTALKTVARGGYAVNGLLHLLIGAIAIGVALGAGGGSADQSGALGQLAATPGGVFVLWTVVVGLVALGIWQIVQAILVRAQDEKRVWAERAVEFGKAVAYLAVAATAFTFAMGGSSDSASDTRDFSTAVLAAPGGAVLLGAIGLGIMVIGGYFCVKGAAKKFRDDITLPPGRRGDAVSTLGTVGYIAKGVALAVVGLLFVVAAFTADPSQATGLDGALKALVELPFGVAILVAVGAGLIAFGLYSFARAKLARL